MSEPEHQDDRTRITDVLQRLHDRGVVDLDAPVRDVAPFLERKIRTVRSVDEDDYWWILIGRCGDDACVFFGVGGDF